jgi:hypothetical protein
MSGPARHVRCQFAARPVGAEHQGHPSAGQGRAGFSVGGVDGRSEVARLDPRVRFAAGLEERGLQRPLADRVVLAHDLVQPAVPENAVAVFVDVHAV